MRRRTLWNDLCTVGELNGTFYPRAILVNPHSSSVAIEPCSIQAAKASLQHIDAHSAAFISRIQHLNKHLTLLLSCLHSQKYPGFYLNWLILPTQKHVRLCEIRLHASSGESINIVLRINSIVWLSGCYVSISVRASGWTWVLQKGVCRLGQNANCQLACRPFYVM